MEFLLTCAHPHFVAAIAAVIHYITNFIESDTASIATLKFTLPAAQHRRHHQDATIQKPNVVCKQKKINHLVWSFFWNRSTLCGNWLCDETFLNEKKRIKFMLAMKLYVFNTFYEFVTIN